MRTGLVSWHSAEKILCVLGNIVQVFFNCSRKYMLFIILGGKKVKSGPIFHFTKVCEPTGDGWIPYMEKEKKIF